MLEHRWLWGVLLASTTAFADSPRLERIDALHPLRDQAAERLELEAELERALAEEPLAYATLWRAARHKAWLARVADDDGQRRRLGEEGRALADRAVAANPKGAEGYFYGALAVGQYAKTLSVFRAVSEGVEGQLTTRLDQAVRLDDSVECAGPSLIKARYYAQLPWPKKDLPRALRMMEAAVSRCPDNLLAKFYLAEALLDDGREERARALFTQVRKGQPGRDPPQARWTQRQAKEREQALGWAR